MLTKPETLVIYNTVSCVIESLERDKKVRHNAQAQIAIK